MPDRKERKVALYNRCNEYIKAMGVSIRECASHFGLNYMTLCSALVRYGFRPLGGKGGRRRMPFDEHYFDAIDDGEKAYYIGLMLARGYIRRIGNNHCLYVRLREQDEYIIDALKSRLGLRTRTSRCCGFSYMHMTIPDGMLSTLGAFGIRRSKSFTEYSFPDIDDSLLPAFIRGYYDGNGWACIRSSAFSDVEIRSNSRAFLVAMGKRLEAHGIGGQLITDDTGGRKVKRYKLHICGSRNQGLFRDFINGDGGIRSLRKHDCLQAIPC